MFGHQDEPQQMPQDDAMTPSAPAAPSDGTFDAGLAAEPAIPPTLPADSASTPLLEAQADDGMTDTTGTTMPVVAPVPDSPAADNLTTDTNALLDIKQQALHQLSPLVGHLEQSPEEKFRTTMMMIQASDNQDLIKTAYEAAQAIIDEKTRAQALLDIVNEINYFTQHASE